MNKADLACVPDTLVPLEILGTNVTNMQQNIFVYYGFWCKNIPTMRPELAALNGGSKQFWLRMHRKEVEQYYHENGPDATMAEFNMRQPTLMRFLERRGKDIRLAKLSESDRWVLKVANQGILDIKRRVEDLEAWQWEVQPVIAVGKALIDATAEKFNLKAAPPALPDDPLKLRDLMESREFE